MKEYMRQVASTPDPETGIVDLSNDERNLLSIAYKNVVNNKRVSWRILYQHILKEKKKENSNVNAGRTAQGAQWPPNGQ